MIENPQDVFLRELPRIERIIASICRRHALHGPDAEDFGSEAKLKLMADDYAVLGKFEGRSQLSTYLMTVISRQFQDYRIKKWGKWRHSARARELGAVAKALEELIARDSHSVDEAIEILRNRDAEAPSRGELVALAAQLPPRTPSRRFESDERLSELADDESADRRVLQKERASMIDRACRALQKALASLPSEDRMILKMRFEDDFTVARIAQQLDQRQRLLYSRIDKLKKNLRASLEAEGIEADVLEFLNGGAEA